MFGAALLGVCLLGWAKRSQLFELVAKQVAQEQVSLTSPQSPGAPGSPESVTRTEEAPGPREIGYQVDGSPRRALVYGEPWNDPRPLVLAADPGGRHDVSMRRLLPAARALRWIVAATPVVRNGSQDAQDTRELAALRTQVEQMFRVDARRVILEGWSGTGCGAYAQVLLNGSTYRGAIVENAHLASWRDYGKFASPGKLVYLFTRSSDFNAPHTRALRDTMLAAGYTVEYEELPGEHIPLQPDEMTRAMRWMDARL